MATAENKVEVFVTLGGKAVSVKVFSGEEAMARSAAEFVEQRANTSYQSFIRRYGERAGLSVLAFECMLEYLRLKKSRDNDELALKVGEVVGRIDEALEE